MKHLMSEGDSKKLLTPYLNVVFRIYSEASSDLRNVLQAAGQDVDKASRSKLLHNFAKNKARNYFAQFPEVELVEKYLSLQLRFKENSEKLLIGRFKKVNKRTKLSANNSTQRANAIVFQLPLFEHHVTYVDFGYTMDFTNTEIDNISVICRLGDSVVWSFDIHGAEGNITNSISVNPTQPTLGSDSLVKLKKAD